MVQKTSDVDVVALLSRKSSPHGLLQATQSLLIGWCISEQEDQRKDNSARGTMYSPITSVLPDGSVASSMKKAIMVQGNPNQQL